MTNLPPEIAKRLEDKAYEYGDLRAKAFGTWNEQDVLNAKVCFEAGATWMYQSARSKAIQDMIEFMGDQIKDSFDEDLFCDFISKVEDHFANDVKALGIDASEGKGRE